MSSKVPRGVPTITYLRVLQNESKVSQKNDVMIDGNVISLYEQGQVY